MNSFPTARPHMVENQIRTNKVTDENILNAFDSIPRENFVPSGKESVAYVDEDLLLGDGRYLMEPMVLARMLQEAQIDENDIVLDVGCCNGYSTAIISCIATSVIGLEESQDYIDIANENLANFESDNAGVALGPLGEGYAPQMPYSLIIIGGAVEEIPKSLFDQLVDGGRLVAVIKGNGQNMGKAKLFCKINGVISDRFLFDAGTPSLTSFSKKIIFQL